MVYRDLTFDIDQTQSTMRHLYLDDRSRNSDTKIVGRGVAMTAASTCSHCGTTPATAGKGRTRTTTSLLAPTTSRRTRNLQTARQHPTLQLSTSGVLYTKLPRMTTRNATSKERHAHRRVDALTLPLLYKARVHAPTTTKSRPLVSTMVSTRDSRTGLLAGSGNRGFHLNGSGNRGFHPNSDRFTMIVDSGAPDHLINEELIPRLRKSMKGYKKLKEPKTIMTNGNKTVFATATGTIWGYVIDQTGKNVPLRISAMSVPGLGRNVFFSIKAMQSGISTILETGNPDLQFDSSTSLPLTQHPEDKGVCFYDVFLRTLGGTADTASTLAVVLAAQARNDANRGDRTFTETQEVCTNSSIAMKPTTTVTPQLKRVSARYGQKLATQKECTPTQAETTRLKRLLSRRLSANIPKSRTSRPRKPLSLRRSAFVR